MADLKISQLTGASTPLAGTEVLPIVQSGATVKVAVSDLTAGRAVSALTLASTTGATFATTSGSVGIGTASPLGVLDVAGTAPTLNIRDTQQKTWTAADTIGTLDFYAEDASSPGARTVGRIRSLTDTTSSSPSGALAFWTAAGAAAATEKMRIDSTGLVGISTTTPAAKLDIGGNPTYTNQLIWSRGVTDTDFKAVLVSGDSGAAATIGSIGVRYASFKDFSSIQFYRNSGVGNIVFFTGTTSADGTEKARIDGSGNFGIGTSSPSASAIIDAQSTTKGVRMPNMTTTQKNAISSPAAGLIVFDTTLAKLCVYSGAAWQTITSI